MSYFPFFVINSFCFGSNIYAKGQEWKLLIRKEQKYHFATFTSVKYCPDLVRRCVWRRHPSQIYRYLRSSPLYKGRSGIYISSSILQKQTRAFLILGHTGIVTRISNIFILLMSHFSIQTPSFMCCASMSYQS